MLNIASKNGIALPMFQIQKKLILKKVGQKCALIIRYSRLPLIQPVWDFRDAELPEILGYRALFSVSA